MKFIFKTTNKFRKEYNRLSETHKQSAKRGWKRFKRNPFDRSLKPHKITDSDGKEKTSIKVEGNLIVLFDLDQQVVTSHRIGNHDIYKKK